MENNLDMNEACEFLRIIFGEKEETEFSVYYDPEPKLLGKKGGKRPGKFDDIKDLLKEENLSDRFGIFCCVNSLKPGGTRNNANIYKINMVWCDFDLGHLNEAERGDISNQIESKELFQVCPPTMMIETKNGYHVYWHIEDLAVSDFKSFQQALIARFNSDKSVCDSSRLMRVPGFLHNKTEPFLVKIIHVDEVALYKSQDLINAFGLFVNNPKEKGFLQQNNITNATELFRALPVESGEANRLGGRNKALTLWITCALGEGIPEEEIIKNLETYCINSGYEVSEGMAVFKSRLSAHKRTPFKPIKNSKKDKSVSVEARVSEEFLKRRGQDSNTLYPVVSSPGGAFIKVKDGSYQIITEEHLQSEVHRFRADILEERKSSRQNKNVVEYIKQDTYRSMIGEHPLVDLKSNEPLDSTNFVVFRNGVYDLRESKLLVRPESLFTTSIIPHDAILDGKAPAFIMEKIREICSQREDVVDLILKFFGLCMVYNMKFQKFLLLLGEGANGKSVLLSLLEAVLGKDSCTSVSLSQIDPKRTFPMAELHLKKANIINEIDSGSRASEGLLKSLISGEPCLVEKKGKAPFVLHNTARFVIAANEPPTISDSSSGFWRRLIAVELTENFEKSGKVDRRLSDVNFWRTHDEMPAFVGLLIRKLKELYKKNNFQLPTESFTLNQKLMVSSNPVYSFFDDCLTDYGMKTVPLNPSNSDFKDKGVLQSELFNEFKAYCEINNIQHKINSKNFASRLKAVLDKENFQYRVSKRINTGQKKVILWLGIKLVTGSYI